MNTCRLFTDDDYKRYHLKQVMMNDPRKPRLNPIPVVHVKPVRTDKKLVHKVYIDINDY